ncbi:MAG: hypothetical protein CO094_06935 [Anaerolineae bacterium CG_4_9_14_3_um_filter_57_17]|nr:PaaI family thioesterase [bacterium]NCT21706.1 PaaI family thioesterase [bacterium]OIO84538.1 MAG: hypothetical protein AUK01_08975 [Anaerolineae bacterium CG2_30_57_67]PJB66500.1 MAG: hypothetical protein CO094_06935 [Anaerolineae bacterium CG_4_9_14_3_um_filter_57_17]
MYQIPEHGDCFVCGTANPKSIGLTWFLEDNNEIYAEFTFDLSHQGPPGHVHGGASAAVLDEAMGAVVWRSGLQVVAARLEVDYKKPLPLGQKIVVRARISEKQARKVFATAEILLEDGRVAVAGKGIYVPAPYLFSQSKFLAAKPTKKVGN